MKIMIIGAHGGIARILTDRLLAETDNDLILFLRQAERLNQYANNSRVTLVEGNIIDTSALAQAMQSADLIYSNAGGTDLADQTKSILAAMRQTKQNRLIFISALGANHEVPGAFGEWNEQAIKAYLPGFRAADALITAADVTYTEIRPAWLSNQPTINYELTQRGEPFKGTEVSRASVADLALKIIQNPTLYQNASVGINQPGTDGDRPSWM